MSNAAFYWADALVSRERQAGATKTESIRRAAHRARVSPGQLEGLLRGRVKDPKISLVERLRAAFIAAGAREIERLNHEITLARVAGLEADHRAIDKARLAISALEDLLPEGGA